jgi:signal transduction histidine kinase
MLRIRNKISLLTLLFVILECCKVYSAKPVKNVLIIFSWSSSLPAYQGMMEGFNAAFSEEPGVTCNLAIEYLDLNRPGSDIVVKTIVGLYNDNYKNIPLDLVIIVGPNGYPVLKENGLKALDQTPVICVDNDTLINDNLLYPQNPDMVKISLNYDFRPTLETAFSLFPGFRDIYVISGISPMDSYYLNKFRISAKNFSKDHSFSYYSNLSVDSLIRRVEKIPRKSLVFVPSYFRDRDGVLISTSDVIAILARRSKAPVLPLADGFTTRKGALGGYVFSFRNVGKEIGRIANHMLKGTSADDIKVRYKTFYEDVYDWDQVKRWNLTQSRLIPSDSLFYYKPVGFWRIYRWYILALFLFLISQTIFIIYLVRLNRRQKETARQKAEAENIYQELVREDRLLKMVELTASLSHELNQPLTAILYNAQAGKRFLKSGTIDPRQAEEIFDYIIEDDKRAGGIISSVKNLMKLDNREMENLNLGDLIQETVDIFKSEYIRKNVTLKVTIPKIPAWIYGEKILLQQVIMNFCRNAINAMEKIDPENRLLEITLKTVKSHVTLSVRDSGCGIDPEIKEKLFRPFVTNSKKGFGIGLALSRTIIEKHHGEIWAENHPEGGAEFCFRLKAKKDDLDRPHG